MKTNVKCPTVSLIYLEAVLVQQVVFLILQLEQPLLLFSLWLLMPGAEAAASEFYEWHARPVRLARLVTDTCCLLL